MELLIGNAYWTPCDPGGPVELLSIEPYLYCRQQTVVVRFLQNHPDGRKRGDIGRYFAAALRDPGHFLNKAEAHTA